VYGQFCEARAKEAQGLVAVVATLSKGHDLTSASSTSHTNCYPATRAVVRRCDVMATGHDADRPALTLFAARPASTPG